MFQTETCHCGAKVEGDHCPCCGCELFEATCTSKCPDPDSGEYGHMNHMFAQTADDVFSQWFALEFGYVPEGDDEFVQSTRSAFESGRKYQRSVA